MADTLWAMESPDSPTARRVDLASLQQGLSTVGWGFVIGGLTCGPVFVSPTGRIGFPSILGSIVVLVGLQRMPLTGTPGEFARRRRVVVVAVVVGWICSVAAFFPTTGAVVGPVGSITSTLAVLLFLAMMTRLTGWLAAVQPHQAWRRLTRFVLGLICVGAVAWILAALLVPILPGASVAQPDGSGWTVNGTQVSGLALVTAAVVGVAFLAAFVVALVLAVQAFSATKRWTRSLLPAPAGMRSDVTPPDQVEDPPSPPAAPHRSRTRVVDGRLILQVDQTPHDV